MELLPVFTVLCLLGLGFGQNVTLPPCPDPPYNNIVSEIVVEELERLKQYMVTGVPELGIPVLDPYGPIPYFSVYVDNDRIQLEDTINETYIYNLSEFVVCELYIDFGIREHIALDFRLFDLSAAGLYELDGIYLSLLPIYGTGNYTLDVYNASVTGNGTIAYLVVQDIIQITQLDIDLLFEDLVLYMECLLGCGEMSDIANQFVSEIATAIFDALWEEYDPILTEALQNALNSILEDIHISEIFTPDTTTAGAVALGDEEELTGKRLRLQVPLNTLLEKALNLKREKRK